MTQLLVSVRNPVEAETALSAGASLIDIKEPLRGALGAADVETIEAIVRAVAGRAPVSAALGELLDPQLNPARLPAALSFVKVGLSRCASLADWRERWRAAIAPLPSGIRPVAVVYADDAALAPDDEAVLEAARELNCAALLIDTFDKSRGDLLSHWSLDRLADLVERCADAGILSVVAGSLRADSIRRVLPLSPDYVAVRGAVCDGSRTAQVKRELVANLVDLVTAGSAA